MTCMLSVMRKELRHMWRDPWVLLTITVGAALLMVLLAYTFSADIEHVPVVAVDGDRSPQSRANRIGIDTGAVYGGKLTTVVLEGTERRFIQV